MSDSTRIHAQVSYGPAYSILWAAYPRVLQIYSYFPILSNNTATRAPRQDLEGLLAHRVNMPAQQRTARVKKNNNPHAAINAVTLYMVVLHCCMLPPKHPGAMAGTRDRWARRDLATGREGDERQGKKKQNQG